MLRSFIWVAVALFSAPTAFAATVKTCGDAEVRSVTRPVLPKSNSSQSFTYKYRYQPASAGQPTLVYIPGGPGGSSMTRSGLPMSIPAGFGLIETDPRGIGCNELSANVPDAFYSSENIASDVVAIITELKLDRYILHGISYGTIVGTIAANLAEKAGRPPEAVILEGILGRAFFPAEVSATFTSEWRAYMQTRLPQEIAAQFKAGSPLSLTPTEWGRAISSQLTIGLIPPSKYDYLAALLQPIASTASASEKAGLFNLVKQTANPVPNPKADRMFKIIACDEIASEVMGFDFNADFTMEKGEFTAVPGHLCDGVPMAHPFDAKDWKTSAPIYYFEGDRDPATPMAQALYNHDSQTLSRRTLVTVHGGGHPAMTLNLMDCRVTILDAIARSGATLSSALNSCALSATALSTAPGR